MQPVAHQSTAASTQGTQWERRPAGSRLEEFQPRVQDGGHGDCESFYCITRFGPKGRYFTKASNAIHPTNSTCLTGYLLSTRLFGRHELELRHVRRSLMGMILTEHRHGKATQFVQVHPTLPPLLARLKIKKVCHPLLSIAFFLRTKTLRVQH